MSSKPRKPRRQPAPPAIAPSTMPFSTTADMGAIVEAMADGVAIYDLTGKALYFNPAALRILGWDAAGIDPCSLSPQERAAIYHVRVISGDPHPTIAKMVQNTQAGISSGAQEWLMHRPDGTSVYIQIRQAPIRDRDTGATIGTVHLFHDITAWYEVNDIKDEFTSIASHELRAPLQPLMMASRFIQRWIARPEHAQEVVELAEEIVRQSKRMAGLVYDMLDMTRISSGRFSIQLAPCDLAKLVRDVVAEQYAISKREISVVGTDAPIPALADSERLWQVLTNLISNAIKYSAAPAPVEITVSQHRPQGMPWVRISVQDRGCGIPADNLPHLFERFYRASVSYQLEPQQQDGLGLGLYIAHAIVQSHGGRLSVESVVDVGSTFTCELPLAPAP